MREWAGGSAPTNTKWDSYRPVKTFPGLTNRKKLTTKLFKFLFIDIFYVTEQGKVYQRGQFLSKFSIPIHAFFIGYFGQPKTYTGIENNHAGHAVSPSCRLGKGSA